MVSGLKQLQGYWLNRKYCCGARMGTMAWLPHALDTVVQADDERFVFNCSVQPRKATGQVMARPPSVRLMNNRGWLAFVV